MLDTNELILRLCDEITYLRDRVHRQLITCDRLDESRELEKEARDVASL